MLELIHCFVEVLDKHFGQVCELDIMNDPDMVGAHCYHELCVDSCSFCVYIERQWKMHSVAAAYHISNSHAAQRVPVCCPLPLAAGWSMDCMDRPFNTHPTRALPASAYALLPASSQVHYIMDEMLMNGCIVDTNKQNILEPVQLLENLST